MRAAWVSAMNFPQVFRWFKYVAKRGATAIAMLELLGCCKAAQIFLGFCDGLSITLVTVVCMCLVTNVQQCRRSEQGMC